MTRSFAHHVPGSERADPRFAQRVPPGNVQRAREEVCRQLSILRLQFNRHGCGEPTNAPEIFAS